MTKNQAKQEMKKNTRYSEFDIDKIVSDFWFIYGEQEELNFDVSSELEGIYANFNEFAKEYFEDVDDNGTENFDSQYIEELKEFYVFCENSGAVFKKPWFGYKRNDPRRCDIISTGRPTRGDKKWIRTWGSPCPSKSP